MSLSPNGSSVLSQDLFHQFDGHFLNGLDALDSEVAEGVVGLGADLGDFAYREWREKWLFASVFDLQSSRGFGLTGCHLAYRLAGAHAK